MDIEVELRCRRDVDMEALRERILAQEPAAWQEQLLRQQEYEVHKYTESIVKPDGIGSQISLCR